MHKFSAAFAAGVLMGSTMTTVVGAALLGSVQFSDVPAGSFFDAAVGRLVEQGIIKGYPDGTFKPDQGVTRGEVAVLIDRAINGVEESGGSTSRRTASSKAASSEAAASEAGTASSKSPAASLAPVGEAGALHFTTTGFNVAKSATRATITVIRTGGKKGEVKVSYEFSGGTAVSGTDYAPSSGTVTFLDGETTKNLSVTLTRGDTAPQKTLDVKLSSPTAGAVLGTPSTATLTLLGSASSAAGSAASAAAGVGTVSFSANMYHADEAAGAISIAVIRTGGSNGEIKVNYATSNGTGTAGKEYNSTQGTMTFAAGETSKTFSVQVNDNATIDGNKTVILTLSNPVGGTAITTPSVTLTIVDSEVGSASGTAVIQFSAPNYLVTEGGGSVTITVLRSSAYTGAVSVNYATGDGSATAASDYTATSGTMTFAAGESSKTFVVPILKDSNTENEETVNLYLNNTTGPGTIGSQSTATIKIQ